MADSEPMFVLTKPTSRRVATDTWKINWPIDAEFKFVGRAIEEIPYERMKELYPDA